MSENLVNETKEERKLLIPKIDVVFHSLFRTSREKITGYFISSLLQTKVKVLTMDKDRHLVRKYPDEKLGILDLRTELEGGDICNIEVQLANKGDIIDRILYYWSRSFGEQLQEGEEYQELHKTIEILIVDFELKELAGIEELGGKWKIILDEDDKRRVLTDKLELVILEIPKARRIIKKEKDNKIAQWLMFLDNPNSKEVTRIMGENKEIKEAVEELDEMSQDEELKRLAFLKEKYIRDEKSAQRYFREEGREENKRQIAKKMLDKNMPIELIAELTNLSEEEVKKL